MKKIHAILAIFESILTEIGTPNDVILFSMRTETSAWEAKRASEHPLILLKRYKTAA